MDADAVHTIVRTLLAREEPGLLVPPGPWDPRLQKQIAALSPTSLPQRCLQASLFLWNDDLWGCHDLVQKEEDEHGALLHAVLHRREPDAGNAKYWFRRVHDEPLFPQLLEAAKELAREGPDLGGLGRELAAMKTWDALRMVDWCEAAGAGDENRFLRALQALELQGLCYAWLTRAGFPRP